MQNNLRLKREAKLRIAKGLFPEAEIIVWTTREIDEKQIPSFSRAELDNAIGKIKNKKASGMDGFSPEFVKMTASAIPTQMLDLFNEWLRKQRFPKKWKEARLVLIEKERKEEEAEPTYRPICLLNILGKVYERLINDRILEDINIPFLLPSNHKRQIIRISHDRHRSRKGQMHYFIIVNVP